MAVSYHGGTLPCVYGAYSTRHRVARARHTVAAGANATDQPAATEDPTGQTTSPWLRQRRQQWARLLARNPTCVRPPPRRTVRATLLRSSVPPKHPDAISYP